MLQEGLLFANRYTLVRLLGRGGFAEVWLADDTLTHVQVAVKVYAPGTGLDDNGIRMFTEEFAVVFDMNHTNLLRPTHYDCYERQPYLIMPYIKNGSAFKYLTEGRNMPEDECWKMLHDVAAGLAYLHAKTPPLIHQDIKPDNIMIDDEGRYLITDFGISARIRSTIRGAQQQEQSGGTLAYMGPERFSATPRPIMASDVWSLGAMMFELMTGQPPFGNHGGLLQKNGADIPLIEEGYSQALKDIICGCLATSTWERPSAAEIEEITYAHLHGTPMPMAAGQDDVAAPETVDVPAADDALAATAEATVPTEPAAEAANRVSQQRIAKKGNIARHAAKLESAIEPAYTVGTATPIWQAPDKEKNATTADESGMLARLFRGKGLIYGSVAMAGIIIASIVGMCSRSDETPEHEDVTLTVEEVPIINYDSLARLQISEGLDLAWQADTFVANHPDDMYDVQYPKVEATYIDALSIIKQTLSDTAQLSTAVSSEAQNAKNEIERKLRSIRADLLTLSEFIPECKERADTIAAVLPAQADSTTISATNENYNNNEETY